jgi:hypothetical protein
MLRNKCKKALNISNLLLLNNVDRSCQNFSFSTCRLKGIDIIVLINFLHVQSLITDQFK